MIVRSISMARSRDVTVPFLKRATAPSYLAAVRCSISSTAAMSGLGSITPRTGSDNTKTITAAETAAAATRGRRGFCSAALRANRRPDMNPVTTPATSADHSRSCVATL